MKIVFNNPQKLNEIVFAKRNKDYGAYVLRTEYNKTLLKSLSIVFSTVLLFMFGAYVFTKVKDVSSLVTGQIDPGIVVTIDPLVDPPKPKDPPKENQGGKKVNGVATRITDTDSIPKIPNIDPNVNLNPFGNPNSTGTLTGIGPGTVAVITPTVVEIPEPPTPIPAEAPEFEGGIKALGEFIKRNTVYPELAKEMGLEGTVYVSFIIDEKGQIESSKILKGVGGGCSEEATRVVGKIPKFKKPGRNEYGKPVKTIFNLPIAFKLQ